jgi:hypothetical protein
MPLISIMAPVLARTGAPSVRGCGRCIHRNIRAAILTATRWDRPSGNAQNLLGYPPRPAWGARTDPNGMEHDIRLSPSEQIHWLYPGTLCR